MCLESGTLPQHFPAYFKLSVSHPTRLGAVQLVVLMYCLIETVFPLKYATSAILPIY